MDVGRHGRLKASHEVLGGFARQSKTGSRCWMSSSPMSWWSRTGSQPGLYQSESLPDLSRARKRDPQRVPHLGARILGASIHQLPPQPGAHQTILRDPRPSRAKPASRFGGVTLGRGFIASLILVTERSVSLSRGRCDRGAFGGKDLHEALSREQARADARDSVDNVLVAVTPPGRRSDDRIAVQGSDVIGKMADGCASSCSRCASTNPHHRQERRSWGSSARKLTDVSHQISANAEERPRRRPPWSPATQDGGEGVQIIASGQREMTRHHRILVSRMPPRPSDAGQRAQCI